MKMLLLIATVMVSSSCGITEGLNKNCGSSIDMGCNFIFGMKDEDQDKKIADNTFKNDEQDARISALEKQNEQLISSMESFSEQLVQLGEDDQANKLYLEGLITSLTNTVSANLITLNNLSSNLNGIVTKMIDVCGDDPGHYDEIVLKTNTGKYIAYFEDGGKRFLTEIPFGNYSSTDRQVCSFTISSSGLTHVVNGVTRID